MYKQPIYCEIEFLQNFFNNIPQYNYENSKEFEIWDNYKSLFLNNCTLTLDEEQKFKELLMNKNELFIILNKRCDGAYIDIQFDKKNDIELLENSQELFFLTDTKKCKELEENYGMMFISAKTLDENADILFEQATIPIDKKGSSISNWNFIEKYKHPCNAMIIADNYLLKQDGKINKEELQNNLLLMLDKLLPEKLNKLDFHLTIITGDGRNFIDIKNRYEYLNTELQKLRSSYKIELKIIGKSIDNHDRNIITNYLHIYSGFGFTLFKERNKVLANTTISINPVTSKNDIQKIVFSLKNQYRNIVQEVCNVGTQIIVFPIEGNTNRLLK